jgi:prepilin-type N-terminal cleavage/methylation domain-containing protein
MPAIEQPMTTPAPTRAFTLIELLVVIAIIMILAGMILGSTRIIRTQANRNASLRLISELSAAFDEYRSEDPRRLYPTPPFANQAGANYLAQNPADPHGVLNVLQFHSTYTIPNNNLDQDAASPSYLCLVDAWRRPCWYQLDGAWLTATGVQDSHLMNHLADRPLAALGTPAMGIAPTWNSQNVEPFAYLWSTGAPTANPAADSQPANWPNWIYPATSQ